MPKKKKEVLVSESSESDSESSESEEEQVSEEEVSEEPVVVETDVKLEEKSKKKKETNFENAFDELIKITSELSAAQTQLVEVNKTTLKLQQVIKKLNKKLSNCGKELKKQHDKAVKKASKEKRKRKTPNTGGFNSPKEIPPILREYIGKELLPDDVKLLKRPAVLKLLNQAFIRDHVKDGQIAVLNKKVAKKLGRKNKEKIEFRQFQTFLASFYKTAQSQ